MVSITLKKRLNAAPEQVKPVLLDHEQLGRFFNAKFLQVKPQNEHEEAGGVGTIRQVTMSGVTFNEKIVAVSNTHITYQIIGSKPVDQHQGDIYFTAGATPYSCNLTYIISCKSPWWLPSSVLAFFIKRDISQAINKLHLHFLGGQ